MDLHGLFEATSAWTAGFSLAGSHAQYNATQAHVISGAGPPTGSQNSQNSSAPVMIGAHVVRLKAARTKTRRPMLETKRAIVASYFFLLRDRG